MPKQRIQVYTQPELKRRIELAATRRDIPVTQYCLDAIKQQLTADGMLEKKEVTIPIENTKDSDLIADLHALRQKIKTRRGGKLISLDVVRQVREEREHELLSGMR